MANLVDLVVDSEPSSESTGVPLRTNPYFVLTGIDYLASTLSGLFLEGPDTDQFVGPGGAYMRFPDGISTGDLDDLLESPGYKGIVSGAVDVSVISGNTRVMFTSTQPLYANTDYTLFLSDVEDASEATITGMITLSFQTGSGAIEELPTDSSTSVLATTAQASRAIDALTPLTIEKTTPADHAIQQVISLEEIEVSFNKSLNESTISVNDVKVETFPVTDHPKLTSIALGDLATSIEVDGNLLKIKI